MNEDELHVLINRIAHGDDGAFQPLMSGFQPLIQNYIARYLHRRADIEDILQETFLKAYRSLKDGQYRHINLAAFKKWLRTIAWHLIIYASTSQKLAFEPLSYVDSEGSEVFLDIPDPADNVEHKLTQLNLAGFLDLQLDEVLIKSESTREAKDIGLLKKIAFMRFYVDQYSQKELVELINDYAVRLNLSAPISQATINNWVSRGDILKGLARHLVEEHYDFIQQVMGLTTVAASLDDHEKALLQNHWDLHQSSEPAADDAVKVAKRKLAESLFKHIKQQLHDYRHQ